MVVVVAARRPLEPSLVVGSDPWGAVLMLLAVPLTLGTAAVVQQVRAAHTPPPFLCADHPTARTRGRYALGERRCGPCKLDPQVLLKAALPSPASTANLAAWDNPNGGAGQGGGARSTARLLNEAGGGGGARQRGGWLQSLGQLWPWGAGQAASRAGYREVELGEVGGDVGRQQAGGGWGWGQRGAPRGNGVGGWGGKRGGRGLFDPRPEAPPGGALAACCAWVRGAGVACVSCCLVRTRRGRWKLQRPGWFGGIMGVVAWALYAWGLWTSFAVIHVSAPVPPPLPLPCAKRGAWRLGPLCRRCAHSARLPCVANDTASA